MKGETIKEELRRQHLSIADFARWLGTSNQNLSAALMVEDVKTSLLEKAAEFMGKDPGAFYDGGKAVAVANGTNGKATAHVQADAGIAALAKQLDVKDEQIDRLLSLLEARK